MAKKIKIKFKIPVLLNILLIIKKKILKNISFCVFWVRKAFNRAISDIKTKKIRGMILLILFVLIFWKFGINAGLLWLLFLSFLFYAWENRIIAFFALISLTSCPFLLSFKKEGTAEIMAVYAYYFLVMTVVLQIAEYKREDRKNKK